VVDSNTYGRADGRKQHVPAAHLLSVGRQDSERKIVMHKELRDQILLCLEEHARTGSLYFKSDKEIAEQLGRPVSEINRQLDILDSQGLITPANSHQGNSARINPRGSLAVEQIEASSKNTTSAVLSVFISHSHDDAELVKRLIILLRSALNLPSQQIRATSVDGFRLPGGSNTTEQLRVEVQEAAVLIGLISKSSLQSAFVIFELGARWGSGKPMIPLLAPDMEPKFLVGPLKEINALKYNSPAQIHQLVEDMARHLGVEIDRPAAYQKCIDEMVQLSVSYNHEPVVQASNINITDINLSSAAALGDDAKALLLGAAEDHEGVVMRFRTATGLHIKAGDKDFVQNREPRTEARWQGALNELVGCNLLLDRNGNGDVFGMTNLGYSVADELQRYLERPNPTNRADG